MDVRWRVPICRPVVTQLVTHPLRPELCGRGSISLFQALADTSGVSGPQ
jgi:hypothetical protein